MNNASIVFISIITDAYNILLLNYLHITDERSKQEKNEHSSLLNSYDIKVIIKNDENVTDIKRHDDEI
jgi:hypothetical protein